MKKIFAIALALVMVLSMASAFASACTTGPFSWDCLTETNKCGKAKVEVIPYVKVNNGCGGYDWQVSTCASAINSENVYFAIKLTVDANTDPDWFANSKIKITGKGVTMPKVLNDWKDAHAYWNGVKTDEDETVVYYLKTNVEKWVDEEDDSFKLSEYIFTAKVTDAKKAKVCATITSDSDNALYTFARDLDGDGKDDEIINIYAYRVGKYYVYFADVPVFKVNDSNNMSGLLITDNANVDKLIKDAVDAAKKGEEFEPTTTIVGIALDGVPNAVLYVTDTDGKITSITKTSKCSSSFYNEVVTFFGLDMCTCLNKKNVNANLGWDDEFKSCFQWSINGASVVDPECKIEIPKTGDVSVVAYAVMALVAAAGAMGLKK